MTADENQSKSQPQPEEPASPSSDSWQEVGRQFQSLGESLAAALRAAWEKEENRARLQELQTGLGTLVDQVGQAVQETIESPQGQQAKDEAKKAADSFQTAFEQTSQEVRPQLVNALQQVNTELQNLITRLKND
jgi:hypothetical protein